MAGRARFQSGSAVGKVGQEVKAAPSTDDPSDDPVKKKRRRRKAAGEDACGARHLVDCGGCGEIFKSVIQLRAHFPRCDRDGEEATSICPAASCPTTRVFHSYAKYRVHKMTHDKSFGCEECEKKFNDYDQYRKHMANVHERFVYVYL